MATVISQTQEGMAKVKPTILILTISRCAPPMYLQYWMNSAFRKADYFGYSLGGWIGFDLAIRVPGRFGSFIFGGSHPYAENMQPFRDLMPRDREAFAAMIDQGFGSRLLSVMRTRLLANDLDALRALTLRIASPDADGLPSMAAALPAFRGRTSSASPPSAAVRVGISKCDLIQLARLRSRCCRHPE